MATAAEHYDNLLAEHYTWMLGGDIDTAATTQADLLRELGLEVGAVGDAIAVDLGCGPGPQTLALVQLGYVLVNAVDTSALLLEELLEHAKRSGAVQVVRPVHSDVRGVLPRLFTHGSVAAIVCMGDTLPHLPSRADVQQLVTEVAEALRPGGSFVVTYRDLTAERHGTDRFIPVRNTADRILTCLLEYVDESSVTVYDLLHSRHDGAWRLETSSYSKLRLSHQWLVDQCHAADLVVRQSETTAHGLQLLHAVKR